MANHKLRYGTCGIGSYLNMIRGVKIDKNRVMMEEGIAMEELNKKGRKKPWTGYDERGYNFSAGHMD